MCWQRDGKLLYGHRTYQIEFRADGTGRLRPLLWGGDSAVRQIAFDVREQSSHHTSIHRQQLNHCGCVAQDPCAARGDRAHATRVRCEPMLPVAHKSPEYCAVLRKARVLGTRPDSARTLSKRKLSRRRESFCAVADISAGLVEQTAEANESALCVGEHSPLNRSLGRHARLL